MEKSLDEKIFELRNTLKMVIANSNLNVSVVEMIVHELYLEIKQLSDQNLKNVIAERKKQENAQEDDQNDG